MVVEVKNNYTYWYFRISGALTAIASIPAVFFPRFGASVFSGGMEFSSYETQYIPFLGHWAVMVTGIGVLIFISATQHNIRKYIIWYSLFEKTYMVSLGLSMYFLSKQFFHFYYVVICLDFLQVIGGVYYLLKYAKNYQS